MDEALIQQRLQDLPNWTREGHKLRRALVFKDFRAAFAFMTQVAELAEQQHHHPDWSNSWNKVVIELTSHDEKRLGERDFRLARAIDALLSSQAP
jgi:4a-hydroxytetrahydrobiopterin dehydratase